jgi:hypothetical protein
MYGYPAKTIAKLSGPQPRTAAAGTLRSAHPSGSGRGRRPRVNVTAIYAERNTPRAEGEPRKASPPPRRPRTIRDLASAYYGPPSSDGQLIPAGSRGGAR